MFKAQFMSIISLASVYLIFYALYLQFVFYGFIAFFVFYWVSSIFVFLFKSGVYSKATSVVQRFWKRTLYLFWSIEFFLFFIYGWLVLIAPSEVEWMFHQSQLFSGTYVEGSLLFSQILFTLSIIYVTTLVQYFMAYSKVELFLLSLLLLLFAVLIGDGSQIITLSLYYGGVSTNFNSIDLTWSVCGDILENSAKGNYTWLVVLLKFWHTAFIVVFYLFILMFFLQTGRSFHGMYSSIMQNFAFLYLFSFILYYFLVKVYLNIVYSYVYSWFLINKYTR